MPRLNFGSAFDIHDGWVNLDKDDHGQDIIADVLNGLPFEDDHFDCIVANHSLQMIRFDDLPRALAELRRVLKPDGIFRILVPDIKRALRLAMDHKTDLLPVSNDIEPTNDGKFLRYIFWHGDARSAFSAASLSDLLKRSGFIEVVRVEFGVTGHLDRSVTDLDSREAESLIVEATK